MMQSNQSEGFYNGHADPDSRSTMNVTFTLNSDETTKSFLAQAKEAGFVGLNGHRSIGGCKPLFIMRFLSRM